LRLYVCICMCVCVCVCVCVWGSSMLRAPNVTRSPKQISPSVRGTSDKGIWPERGGVRAGLRCEDTCGSHLASWKSGSRKRDRLAVLALPVHDGKEAHPLLLLKIVGLPIGPGNRSIRSIIACEWFCIVVKCRCRLIVIHSFIVQKNYMMRINVRFETSHRERNTFFSFSFQTI